MQSLSLSRPLVIMMLGIPGAGKSFFARQFSETFSAPLVSFDRLRYELFTEPKFSKDEETIIERLALSQTEELLKTKKTFLIDGAMGTRVSRANIEKIANQNGYGTLIVWVQTDPQTTKVRSLKRNPKRPFDDYSLALSLEMYEKLAKHINPPLPREPYIVISGKHTYATQAKAVLSKLVSPREGVPNLERPEQPANSDMPRTETLNRRSVIIQ